MAYFYVDDGYPESQDYENNYIYFNGNDSECVQKMVILAQALGSLPAEKRRLVAELYLSREKRDWSKWQFC